MRRTKKLSSDDIPQASSLPQLMGFLMDKPIELSELEKAFSNVPLLQPVEHRIIAMIVGSGLAGVRVRLSNTGGGP